jgi:eukaryotic-like serine/threonine-protein kinase
MRREPGSLCGRTLGGIYKMQRRIGSGGMGEVYAAEAEGGEQVAVKILHDKAARNGDIVARFHREARIAAQIKSPYIATLRGAGKDCDGRLWIAFELLTGEGLDARLRREHSLSFEDVAPIVDDALQGLGAAHEAGVIHRDIKPANLFIEKRRLTAREIAADESEERTRILDFGVSKIRARAAAGRRRRETSLTAFDATLGTFATMAPEQVRGSARVDQRADLYALGVVTFRALSGRMPFEGANVATLLALKLDREAPTLSSTTGDGWPAAIEGFLFRMMARDREDRFSDAGQALAGWRAVCRQIHSVVRRRRPHLSFLREEAADTTTRTISSTSTRSA